MSSNEVILNLKEQNTITPLPKKKIAVILIILISEMSSLMYVSPFLPFMIQSFEINEKDVGRYSGLILSSFMLGQFLSNYIWGLISEKIGIKPVLLMGLISSFICTIVFGFSSNIIWAIITRLLQGIFSGNLGVTKTYLYLITDKSNETKAFAMYPVGMCIGAIFSPAIGGLLETPSKYWSTINENHIFGKYPYLLPSFVISLLPLFGFIIGYFNIEEVYKEKEKTTTTEIVTWKEIFNKNVIITSLLYFNIRFSLMGSDNLFPLLLATSKENKGLNFNSTSIGIIFMISAIILMLFSIIKIPKLKIKYGTYNLFLIVQLLNPITLFMLSLLSDMNKFTNTLLYIFSALFFVLKGSMAIISMILVNLMINNSGEKKYLGRINGFSQSLAALGSIIGPLLSGTMYSWSISNNKHFPLDIHFAFIIFSLISVTNIFISLLLEKNKFN
jgi:MFS family permease